METNRQKNELARLIFNDINLNTNNLIHRCGELGDSIEYVFGDEGSDKTTLLGSAIKVNRLDYVNALISSGANPDALYRAFNSEKYIDSTLLSVALNLKNKSIVHALVKAGADVRAKDENSLGLVSLSVINGWKDVLIDALDKGASIDGDDHKIKPIYLAFAYDETEILQTLIDRGANVNDVNEDGQTVLIFAASSILEYDISTIISAGAEMGIVDVHGKTALHYAILNGKLNNVISLVEGGAELNFNNDDLHYVKFSKERGRLDILDFLSRWIVSKKMNESHFVEQRNKRTVISL